MIVFMRHIVRLQRNNMYVVFDFTTASTPPVRYRICYFTSILLLLMHRVSDVIISGMLPGISGIDDLGLACASAWLCLRAEEWSAASLKLRLLRYLPRIRMPATIHKMINVPSVDIIRRRIPLQVPDARELHRVGDLVLDDCEWSV